MAAYSLVRPVGFYFKVEFPDLAGDNGAEIYFQEVSGLAMEIETESVKQGAENRFTQQLPTRAKYPDLVLKRSLKVNSALIAWCQETIQNQTRNPEVQPQTVIVKVLNDQGDPLLTYNFVNAYPKKWAISDLNAQDSKLVIETLEFYYQYFTIL